VNIAFTYNVKRHTPSPVLDKETDLDFDDLVTVKQISRIISGLGHHVIPIEANETAFEKLKRYRSRIDLVFNIAEGLRGEARESQIPLFCEMLHIPYTHSSPTTQAISLDKTYTKLLLKGAGLRVPGSVIISSPKTFIPGDLQFPLIIKPNSEGSSIGIFDQNIVDDRLHLLKRIKQLYSSGFKGSLMAEEYIDGREFTVGLLGNNPPEVLPIIEQKFDFLPPNLHHIAGFELKWIYEDRLPNLSVAYECPARLSPELKEEITSVSLQAFLTLNIRDCARIDYRLSRQGKLYFIEINPLPGLNPKLNLISYFPLAARSAGLSFSQLVDRIILSAAKRYGLK
jgi:D-alanine-D-alanine ligase